MVSARPVAAGLVLVGALALAVPAVSQTEARRDVSSAELRTIAARASSSPVALEALRRVEQVDGEPVDMDVVLAGAEGPALDDRLTVLAATPDAPVRQHPVAAGAQARRILAEPRFKEPAQPRPLRGFFRWLGDRVAPLLRPLRPLGRPFAAAFRAVTDGGWLSLAVGGVVVALAVFISARLVRRRGRRLAVIAGRAGDGTRDLDPDALERDAATAEEAGRLDEAIHLRFLAGLVRLDRAGVIELRPSLTSGALRRRVPSPALRDLTVTFEEIAYGGRPAVAADVAAARAQWPRALEDARR